MGIILQTRNITKKFGNFVANELINLDIQEGEIHAIIGENGAGKSTLMNMLYGQFLPTSGDIYLRSQKVVFSSPKDAIKNGIGMVHQHFMLVPSFKVYENVILGAEIKNQKFPFLVDKKKEIEKCEELIAKYRMDLDPRAQVSGLSVGQQQKIEILKMLYRDVDILILDEPTSVLTPQEVDELLDQLKTLKALGKTIIIITHKLREVMEVSDSVSIIKKGKLIDTVKTQDTSAEELAQLMVGRKVLLTVRNEHKEYGEDSVVYETHSLSTTDANGLEVVKNIFLTIRKGEIYGIAGVEGNGQSELVKVLTGMMEATKGSILYEGRNITNFWAADLRTLGMGFIPEDRYAEGLCLDMTLADNAIAGSTGDKKYNKGLMFNNKEIRDHCQRLIDEYEIRIADFDGDVSQLSGGNAQKLIIAREMARKPKFLIASQPTRGVDIGAIEFIHRQILNFRDQGGAVLLVSSELSEILSLSDRIGVMYKGEIIGEVDPELTNEKEMGLLMAGHVGNEVAV